MCELLALSSSQPARLTFSLRILAARGGLYRPVGQTDSELAFCALLARLTVLWLHGDPPPLESPLSVLTSFAAELRALGPANFLYANGDALFAHGDRRLQRSGHADPPGLWVRQRRCPPGAESADQGAGLAVRTDGTSVVWVASVPLTDDPWQPLDRGEWVAIRDGVILAGASTVSAPDRAARTDHAL